MTEPTQPEAVAGLPLRSAIRWSLLAAAVASSLLGAILYSELATSGPSGREPGTLSPGEFDLLLTARAIAAFDFLPLWAGSIHPEAIGTYLGACEVAVLLLLGISGVTALKLCGLLHFALLCAASVGLTARLGGARAAALSLGILSFATPNLFGYHLSFLATTTEVIGLQLVALWWLIELRWSAPRLPGARLNALACGLLLGVTLIYSSHSLLLVLFSPVLLIVGGRPSALERLPQVGMMLGGIITFALPWQLGSGAPGLETSSFTLKSVPVADIITNLGVDDLVRLTRQLPFALSGDPELGGVTGLLHVAWLLALLAGLLWSCAPLLQREHRRHPPIAALLGFYGLAALTPMLFAGDLAGYPAAYRYCFNGLTVGVVLLGLHYAEQHQNLVRKRGRRPGTALALLLAASLAPGLVSLPSQASWELTSKEAAFFAAQHRLLVLEESPHLHFALLSPHVLGAERANWFQGYGMLLGEEFAHHRSLARARTNDPESSVPSAALWLQASEVDRTGALLSSFSIGLGLGLALDGTLSEDDLVLAGSVPGAAVDDLWFGIGAALGEHSFWGGSVPTLTVEGGAPALETMATSRVGFQQGYLSIEGVDAMQEDKLTALLDNDAAHWEGSAQLSLTHPFMFTRFAQEGRGEFK